MLGPVFLLTVKDIEFEVVYAGVVGSGIDSVVHGTGDLGPNLTALIDLVDDEHNSSLFLGRSRPRYVAELLAAFGDHRTNQKVVIHLDHTLDRQAIV